MVPAGRIGVNRRFHLLTQDSHAARAVEKLMISGYYILPISVFHAAASKEPFHACAHQIDPAGRDVICWARFPDSGHEQRFIAREGVEALPDPTRNQPITHDHAIRLQKYGVKRGDTTLDVKDRLMEVAGQCMRLPSF